MTAADQRPETAATHDDSRAAAHKRRRPSFTHLIWAAVAVAVLVVAFLVMRSHSGVYTGTWSGDWDGGPSTFRIAQRSDGYRLLLIDDPANPVVVAYLERDDETLVVTKNDALPRGGYAFALRNGGERLELTIYADASRTGAPQRTVLFTRQSD